MQTSRFLRLAFWSGVIFILAFSLALPVMALSIIEYPLPTSTSNLYQITAGPDGNLWFAEADGNKIGKITPGGTITEYPIPTTLSSPVGITNGPDGNIWFTEYIGNKIGKITPSGTITEYPLPTAISWPFGITAGPDGNLWFTEFSSGKIGKITPAGVITEYTVGASQPFNITSGPDGNLWLTEYASNRIGKLTTSGVFTEYALPAGGDGPIGITLGPDNNLWFTEYVGNKIGKITTAGVVTEYAVPTATASPYGITAGSDGNLWFTEYTVPKIGQITPSGVITEYSIPTANSFPLYIASGPDGNVWLTETVGNKIAKISLDGVNPTLTAISLPSTVDPGLTSFTVTFSESMADPTGHTNPDDVTNPDNYLLIEKGANGLVNTASCAGKLADDDLQVTLSSVAYNPATYTSTVTLASGLPAGSYRLFVCGTTSIVDLAGNPINGGSDFIFDFTVQSPATTVAASTKSKLPDTGFAPGKITYLPAQPVEKAYANTELSLEIPVLHLKTAIVGVPQDKDGWDVTWLGQNAGWLNGTAFPTWEGNSVLTGHVWNANNQPGLFVNLKNLKYGNQITVHAFGQAYTYEVRENQRISANSLQTVLKHEDRAWLTLLTCEDYRVLWNTYSGRRMVRAVLVSVK